MTSFKRSDTKLGTWVRGVSRYGILCGVLVVVPLSMGGCIDNLLALLGGNLCAKATVNDNNPCTVDTCAVVSGKAVVTHTPKTCATGLVCNPTGGACVECFDNAGCNDTDACTTDTCGTDNKCAHAAVTGCCKADADCDDTDACTTDTCAANACVHTAVDCNDNDACTDDTCVAATGCVHTDKTCNTGETCVNGTCETSCTVATAATDCDDSDACTDDACDATTLTCTHTAKDCNDNVACTTDTCTAGVCDHADNCAAGETCNMTSGLCEAGTACTVATEAADCPDDLVFCNGAESCDATTLVCVHAGDPCVAPATCDEVTNACINPTGTTFTLTLALDTFTGAAADDTFTAPLIFNAPSGTNVPSLQTGDNLNGVGGADVLNATFNNTAATTVQPTIAGIATFNVTDFGSTASTTFSCTSTTGVTAINATNGTNTFPLVFTNVPNVVNVGLTNTNAGMTVSYATTATSASTDAMTATLSNVTAGTLTITSTGANGIETLNLSSGGAANTLAAITQTTGTSLAKITVAGDKSLKVTAALPMVTTLDCSTMTANTELTLSATAANVAYTGGTADDIVLFGATYTTADVVNGGGGTDTLGMNSAQAIVTSTQSNVSNFETIRVQDQLNGALALAYFGSTVKNAWLSTGSATGSTITMPALGTTGGTVSIENSDNAGTLGITVSGSGTTDVVNLALQNADMLGALTATGAETLNLSSGNGSDGTAADGSANTATTVVMVPSSGTATLNISGSVAFTMSGAITADTINASTLTAALTMGTNVIAAGSTNVVVTGGSGNDTLYGGPGTGDSISGGDGNDNIIILGNGTGTGAANQGDVVAGGSGNNIFKFQAATLADLCATSAGTTRTVKITDFDTTRDKISLINDAGVQTSLTLATGQSIAASSLTDVYANMTAISASVSGAATNAVLITITSGTLNGNKYLYVNNATAGVSNSADMLIELTGITGTLASTNFQFN